jgi:hypothetical protein
MQPWYFYFERLLWFQSGNGPLWSECAILILAVVGVWAGFARKRLGPARASLVRFIALYSGALAAIYTVIGYKTPWCMLGYWHGAILLAGVGASVLFHGLRSPARRVLVGAALAGAAAHLAGQGWAAGHRYAADQRNPYVYAQTAPDLLRLVEKVKAVGEASPVGRNTLIKVMAQDGDYWPLPWYLREFRQIGWWDTLTDDPYAPIRIVSAKFKAGLDERRTHLMAGYFQLRPGVFLELYVELELWKQYLAKNPPKPDPDDE